MSLALASCGYLIDESLSNAPVSPELGKGIVDPKPQAPHGRAAPEHPIPAPPTGSAKVI